MHRRNSYLWWIASWLSFAGALLWKEMAITLPFLVAAHLFLFSGVTESISARLRKTARVSLPYLGIFCGYLALRRHALGVLFSAQRNWDLSPVNYLLSDVRLLGEYWRSLIFPWPLNAYHVFEPVKSLLEPSVLLSIAFLAAAIAAIIYFSRRAPIPAFAAAWVFITLIPVLNLRELGRNALAERYLYIPSIGFCLLLVWLARRLLASIPQRYRHAAGSCALILVLGAYAAETQARSADWKDSLTLFSRTLEVSPNAALVQLEVAQSLLHENHDPQYAEPHYLAAISIASRETPPERQQISLAYADLALMYGDQGQFAKALNALDGVKAADPNDPDVDTERGVVLAESGRWKEAEATFKSALAENSNDVNALAGLGNIALNNKHDFALAIQYLQQALQIHTQADAFEASLLDSLGAAYCESGHCANAIPELQKAIAIAPKEPMYYVNLGKALGLTGHMAQARLEFERALAIDPQFAPAREFLAELNGN